MKEHVLRMGALAEESLDCARNAYRTLDAADLEPMQRCEHAIDRLQMEIDDEILKVLALHQPVAGDLRFLMAGLKITNDLERIGDLTDSIANRLRRLVVTRPDLSMVEFESMMTQTARMLRDALRAFVELNSDLAREVLTLDDEVDAFNVQHFEFLVSRMKSHPEEVDTSIALLSISRNVERIADLATNIAEDVVFMVDAEDVRHPGHAGG